MIIKRLILTFIFGSCLSFLAFAQDPEFSQFYAAPLYLNPALTGSTKCPRVGLNYRNQFPSLSGTFITYAASFDQHIDGIQGGLGVLLVQDVSGEGILRTTNASLLYSYQINISREFAMRIGLQGTFGQKTVDVGSLKLGDMIDPRLGFVRQSDDNIHSEVKPYPDFSTGVMAFSNRIFGGLAFHHLNQPKMAFTDLTNDPKLPLKITAHGGMVIPLDHSKHSTFYISPNILFQAQSSFNQLNFGAYIAKGPLVGGFWFRNDVGVEVDNLKPSSIRSIFGGDAFIIVVGFQQSVFKFGYSYDITVSKLASVSGGAHEFSLAMQFECRPKKKKFRTISCPSF